MKAFATGGMPRPPPAGVDLDRLAAKQAASGQANMMSQLTSAQAVTATPFSGEEAAFESEVVRAEYEKLCRDHAALVQMGESYGGYDPLGKLAFLDALEAVEERWDTFFARFSLMGALNREFVEQTDGFLGSMGMSAADFRGLLREAHDLMRRDAEVERGAAV